MKTSRLTSLGPVFESSFKQKITYMFTDLRGFVYTPVDVFVYFTYLTVKVFLLLFLVTVSDVLNVM